MELKAAAFLLLLLLRPTALVVNAVSTAAAAAVALPPTHARPCAPFLPLLALALALAPPFPLEALGFLARDPDVRLIPPRAAVVGYSDHLPAERDRGCLARDCLVFSFLRERYILFFRIVSTRPLSVFVLSLPRNLKKQPTSQRRRRLLDPCGGIALGAQLRCCCF